MTGLSGQRDCLVYRDSVAGLSGHIVTGVPGTLHTRGHLLKRFENCIHVACVLRSMCRRPGPGVCSCRMAFFLFLTTVQVISSECLSVLLLAQMSSALTASRYYNTVQYNFIAKCQYTQRPTPLLRYPHPHREQQHKTCVRLGEATLDVQPLNSITTESTHQRYSIPR